MEILQLFYVWCSQGMVEAGNEVFVVTPFNSKFHGKEKLPFKIITYKYIWPGTLHKLGYSET